MVQGVDTCQLSGDSGKEHEPECVHVCVCVCKCVFQETGHLLRTDET